MTQAAQIQRIEARAKRHPGLGVLRRHPCPFPYRQLFRWQGADETADCPGAGRQNGMRCGAAARHKTFLFWDFFVFLVLPGLRQTSKVENGGTLLKLLTEAAGRRLLA